MPKKSSLDELFEKYVVRPEDPDACWGWTGHKHDFGYPLMGQRVEGKKVKVYGHVFSFEKSVRKLLPGEKVLHGCDNPECTNDRHLEGGSQRKNIQDMWQRGRGGARRRSTNKLDVETVALIRSKMWSHTAAQLSALHGVSPSMITKIWREEAWVE